MDDTPPDYSDTEMLPWIPKFDSGYGIENQAEDFAKDLGFDK